MSAYGPQTRAMATRVPAISPRGTLKRWRSIEMAGSADVLGDAIGQ